MINNVLAVILKTDEDLRYLQIDPSIDLLILDDGDAVGGVWNSSRVYPGYEILGC